MLAITVPYRVERRLLLQSRNIFLEVAALLTLLLEIALSLFRFQRQVGLLLLDSVQLLPQTSEFFANFGGREYRFLEATGEGIRGIGVLAVCLS